VRALLLYAALLAAALWLARGVDGDE